MTSHISKTSPPTRIFTSERRAAPGLPKSCGRGTLLRLPRVRRIHVDEECYVRRVRHPLRQGSPVSRAGVSCLLMAREGDTAQRASAAQEALTRQPVPRPDGDGPLPPSDDPISYTYTTDLAAIRAV